MGIALHSVSGEARLRGRESGQGPLRVGGMTEFPAFLRDETGASAAEYALIIAIIGGGITFAAMALGQSVGTAVNDTAECMATAGATCP